MECTSGTTLIVLRAPKVPEQYYAPNMHSPKPNHQGHIRTPRKSHATSQPPPKSKERCHQSMQSLPVRCRARSDTKDVLKTGEETRIEVGEDADQRPHMIQVCCNPVHILSNKEIMPDDRRIIDFWRAGAFGPEMVTTFWSLVLILGLSGLPTVICIEG